MAFAQEAIQFRQIPWGSTTEQVSPKIFPEEVTVHRFEDRWVVRNGEDGYSVVFRFDPSGGLAVVEVLYGIGDPDALHLAMANLNERFFGEGDFRREWDDLTIPIALEWEDRDGNSLSQIRLKDGVMLIFKASGPHGGL